MTVHDMARALGRRGGRARASQLSAGERKRIARLGATARRFSLAAARRIAENLAYAETVGILRGAPARITRLRACRGRLPGIYLERYGR